MTEKLNVASALAEAAARIDAAVDLQETLQAIVDVARDSLEGIDEVGISLIEKGGVVDTKAGTGPLVWDLDALQYSLGQGPCLEPARQENLRAIVVNHARHEQRWPLYIPRAVDLGLRAQMGLGLFRQDHIEGLLNLYSTHAEEIDPDVEHLGELFARHAAIALGHARIDHHLHQSIQTRKVIGQATGIIMERYTLTEDRAFAFLSRVSQTSNLKLRAVAEELVNGANGAAG